MTFIITILSLVIERFFHWSHLRQWRWYSKYQHALSLRINNWPSPALLAISVLPWLIIVGVINYILGFWLYGILKLIFGIIVLLYCLGSENLWVQALTCINELNKEDPQEAVTYAQTAFGLSQPKNSQEFHQNLTKAFFIAAQERVFSVAFWFVLLGPLGAVLYRAIVLCAESSELGLVPVATQAQKILDWLPARIFTLFFALGGHFMNVFAIWKKNVKTSFENNNKLLTECGIASLDLSNSTNLPEDGSAEKEALNLLDRAFVIALVMLALVVLLAK